MSTLTELKPAPGTAVQDPVGRSALIDQVVAHSIALAVDPMLDVRKGAAELARLARHDQSVLGRAWLEVVVPALRHPTRQLITAERCLSVALESGGDR
jgi:hypothetical protein